MTEDLQLACVTGAASVARACSVYRQFHSNEWTNGSNTS